MICPAKTDSVRELRKKYKIGHSCASIRSSGLLCWRGGEALQMGSSLSLPTAATKKEMGSRASREFILCVTSLFFSNKNIISWLLHVQVSIQRTFIIHYITRTLVTSPELLLRPAEYVLEKFQLFSWTKCACIALWVRHGLCWASSGISVSSIIV